MKRVVVREGVLLAATVEAGGGRGALMSTMAVVVCP